MAAFQFQFDNPGGELRYVKFRPQATAAPIKDVGNNAAVARSGVGTFSVTFSDKPKGYAGFHHVVGNSLANVVRPVGATSAGAYNETTGVLTIAIYADGTTGAITADIAAGAGNSVELWVLFRGTAKI